MPLCADVNLLKLRDLQAKGDEVVQFGDFTLDLGTRKLKKGEEEIPLTTGEFAVLEDILHAIREFRFPEIN